MISKEEIKLRLFECIANNSKDLCDSNHYMSPLSVASHVNKVYRELYLTDINNVGI